MAEHLMTVGQLSNEQRGPQVTVATKEATITGPLRSVRHYADTIEITALCSAEPEFAPGRAYVDLQVGPWEATLVNPDTLCAVVTQ